jgi:co-chaperonin GroES (HSP10)
MTDQLSLIGLKPLRDRVLVYIYDDGQNSIDIGDGKRLITGLVDTEFNGIYKDQIDGKHPGIRARWAMVVGVNEDTPSDIKAGDKVFLEQMKWRRGITASNRGQRVWDISFHDILGTDDAGFDDQEKAKVDEYLAGFEGTVV